METWAIVTLVIGLNIIAILSSYFLTKMQVSHSDKRLEKELERAGEADYRQRRREVRGEPLLKLRNELARMAEKQDRLVASAHLQHNSNFAKAEVRKLIQRDLDAWYTYFVSGDFQQILFMQDDKELVSKVEEIVKDYRLSYDYAFFHEVLNEVELEKAMKVLQINKTRVIKVQELINKRMEEL